jgi:hypothetical protein
MKQPIEQAQDADLRLSVAAMHRAAQRARELARRTGTYLVVSRDGEVVYLDPDQMEPQTPAASPGDNLSIKGSCLAGDIPRDEIE